MTDIISSIRGRFPDCAITLSLGERSRESYLRFYQAGANRYLLRHETADEEHYRRLHPDNMLLQNRKRCLFDLKAIGYQGLFNYEVAAYRIPAPAREDFARLLVKTANVLLDMME